MATQYVDPEIDRLISYFTGASPDQFNEADTLAAEASLFGGFNSPRRSQYRQSEVNQRYGKALPFIQLRQQAALAAQAEAADAARQIQENNAAMERLQLQLRHADQNTSREIAARINELNINNQGQMERLKVAEVGANTRQTQGDSAALARTQVGEQGALQRFQLGEQGQTLRQATGIAGDLQRQREGNEFTYRENALDRAAREAEQTKALSARKEEYTAGFAHDRGLEDLRQRYGLAGSESTGQAFNSVNSAYRNPNPYVRAGFQTGNQGGYNQGAPSTTYGGSPSETMTYSSPSVNYSQSSWKGNATSPNFYAGPNTVSGTAQGPLAYNYGTGNSQTGPYRESYQMTNDDWINQLIWGG